MASQLTYEELEGKVKQLRNELRKHESACQKQVKEERLRGVLEMAGAVCHELNQPMQALSVYCERFLKERSNNSAAYEEIEHIMDKIERIVSITRKLQTIASYETKEYIQGRKIIDIDKASKAA